MKKLRSEKLRPDFSFPSFLGCPTICLLQSKRVSPRVFSKRGGGVSEGVCLSHGVSPETFRCQALECPKSVLRERVESGEGPERLLWLQTRIYPYPMVWPLPRHQLSAVNPMQKGFSVAGAPFFGFGLADPAPNG